MKKKIVCRLLATAVVVSAAGVLAGPTAWATRGIHNFGGYSAPVVANASADITVPAASSISCSAPAASTVDLWVGLTRGQLAANAGVNIQCVHGSPIMFVSGSAGTASFRFPVFGGDVIAVSTSETASGTMATAQDTTTTVNATANSVGATVLPTIVQFGAVSTSKTIPNLGPVTYSSVTVDGTQLSSSAATARNFVRGKPPDMVPGALSSGTFTLTEN